ncbi:type VI secretion system protein TssR domain-containing protein [Chishuiella sp.]|uniref:type VI secretion system protein TssR domain-containing protein n=1 Tax=Chishuiella sp. TaxID=1969467 RepID=UPI0028AAE571|nr:type VI secretion system protein TssR domain-containing protein [Chishuiella sp.]
MKKYILPLSLVLIASSTIISCSVKLPAQKTPDQAYYGFIEDTKLINGYPKKNGPWVVFSDRENNTVYVDKNDQKSLKEIKFLEPLFVLNYKKSTGLVKVGEYVSDALMKKTPKNSIKSYGWIPEDQLLLWTNALKNQENGFTIKAALVPNNIDVMKAGDKYLQNDSVLVYTSPTLTHTTKKKLPIGQLVYIYKQAENGKRYLIGRSPEIKIDGYQDRVYGWVSANMISYWGEKYAIKLPNKENYDFIINKISLTKNYQDTLNNKSLINNFSDNALEKLIPIKLKDTQTAEQNNLKYYTNILDYSKNFVYNVAGQPIYFDRYKEIVNGSKNLNIVFALDISGQSTKSAAIAKSIFQDFQLKLNKLDYYKNIKYGVVLYKNNRCGNNIAVSELSTDIDVISKYIDDKSKEMKCNGPSGQPYQNAIATAGNLLRNVPDETNIVIAVGSTAAANTGVGESIRTLSKARARILTFQSYSGSDSDFNNFVLASEKIISNSAKNITKLKMEKLVEQNDVVNKNNYNLVGTDEGFYSLDYPKTSMTQGFVIYPRKGEVASNNLLVKALDSLLIQVTNENKEVESSLTKYFKLKVGVDKTEVKYRYRSLFPGAPTPTPYEFASQLVTLDNPFLIKGKIDYALKYSPLTERGILISSEEYENLRQLYLLIYHETIIKNRDFDQKVAIKRYMDIVKGNYTTLKDFQDKNLGEKTMAYAIASTTGYDVYNEDIMTKYSLNNWRKKKIINPSIVKEYFDNYKVLAERLLENKNNKSIVIQQDGETYYWLNQYYLPNLSNVHVE